MATISVQRDGQVTLPPEIRSKYHLAEGALLEVLPIAADRFEVRVVAQRPPLLALIEEFADDGPAPDLDTERQAFGDHLDAALRDGGRRP